MGKRYEPCIVGRLRITGLSQLLIQRYLNEPADLQRVSGTRCESVVREAFKGLLKDWGKSQNLVFAPEYPLLGSHRRLTLEAKQETER